MRLRRRRILNGGPLEQKGLLSDQADVVVTDDKPLPPQARRIRTNAVVIRLPNQIRRTVVVEERVLVLLIGREDESENA